MQGFSKNYCACVSVCVCDFPPVHTSAWMAALSASLVLPLHLNKHHLSWLDAYINCQEAATQ